MLSRVIDENNRFIKSLKSALQSINDDSELSIVLVTDKIKFQKGSMQKINLPHGSEVTAIMPGGGRRRRA